MGKPKVLSVTQLNLLLKNVLEIEFPTVWVAGEISNLSQPRSGHIYFTLKDDESQMRGVIWRSTAERLKFDVEEGMQLVCSGNIDLYPPRGTYQLVVRSAEPLGIGPLQLAFQQLHEKLKKEGLFDPTHKKSIPAYPKRIGVVTSPTGAAIRDFLQILTRRWKDSDVTVIPTRVQGEGVSREIARAIRAAHRIRPALDVLVVTRGGGSLEDLWCFNEEPVVRAIYEATIPTVSAVGHEIDVTLSDLAADLRALTPSEAAEKVVPAQEDLRRRIYHLKNTLDQNLVNRLELAYHRLVQLESRPVFRRPLDQIRILQRRLDELDSRGGRAVNLLLERRKDQLKSLAKHLASVSPLSILGRGYSLTHSKNTGELIASVDQIKNGDLIETQVANGTFLSRVVDETSE